MAGRFYTAISSSMVVFGKKKKQKQTSLLASLRHGLEEPLSGSFWAFSY